MNRQQRRAARKKTAQRGAKLRFIEEENGEVILYVEFDGKRIAKRYPGQGWISLEPGYMVFGNEPGTDYSRLEIHYNPNATEPQ